MAKKKPELKLRLFSYYVILVRLAGIEPTTPWFVAKYSIQLSYSRNITHYNALISFGKQYAVFYKLLHQAGLTLRPL